MATKTAVKMVSGNETISSSILRGISIDNFTSITIQCFFEFDIIIQIIHRKFCNFLMLAVRRNSVRMNIISIRTCDRQ